MTNNWNGQESRWGERVRVDIPVQLESEVGAGAYGRMSNLSLSGALVEADVALGLHSLIQVSITMLTSQPKTAITAYVSRRFEHGVGIEWCEFAPIIIKDLLRLPSLRLPL